jgi:hypothetical protein
MSQLPRCRDDQEMHTSVLIPTLALVAASVALAGCSSIRDVIHSEASYEFDSTSSLALGWNGSAPWVPSDGTHIRVHEAVGGSPSMLRVTTTEDLPASCVEKDRLSAPSFDVDWATNAYVDTVSVCDDWDVIPTPDGYLGWTPIAPGEAVASPTAP